MELLLLVPLPVTFAVASRSAKRDVAADAAVGGRCQCLCRCLGETRGSGCLQHGAASRTDSAHSALDYMPT